MTKVFIMIMYLYLSMTSNYNNVYCLSLSHLCSFRFYCIVVFELNTWVILMCHDCLIM